MLAKPHVLLLLSLWIGFASACASDSEPESDAGAPVTDASNDTLSCFDESLPEVLWFGPDNAGPCEGPCYTVVEGSIFSDEDQCWRSGQPLMCWGGPGYGTLPTSFQVDGLGIVVFSNEYGVTDELAAYGATRVNQLPDAPECDGDDGSGEGSGVDDQEP